MNNNISNIKIKINPLDNSIEQMVLKKLIQLHGCAPKFAHQSKMDMWFIAMLHIFRWMQH
jgi:hypothetical protein